MAGSPSVRDLDMPFTDVQQGWYHDAVLWTYSTGIINGVGEGGASYLRPQGSATRAQAAAMIQRFDDWRTR